ncbi:MAG: endonuclease/exonuclease/phosphatase family protein [Bryobacterales bacterium]|nr:endonuclease/exonuclease/phosphatase family protein [Bryobacterales bacterium]
MPSLPVAVLSVISLNIASQPDAASVAKELQPGGKAAGADVYLLQEVYKPATGPSLADTLAQQLGMHAFFTPSNPGPLGSQIGIAILSRYPLQDPRVLDLPRCDLRFRSRTRVAQKAIAKTPNGHVTVYNLHLDTRVNLDERLNQLRPVLTDAQSTRTPVLIGGDFNTNPLHWVGNVVPFPGTTQAKGTHEYMRRLGFRSALPLGTVTHDLPGFQLDWVFVKGLNVRAANVAPLPISDHHVVRVQLSSI